MKPSQRTPLYCHIPAILRERRADLLWTAATTLALAVIATVSGWSLQSFVLGCALHSAAVGVLHVRRPYLLKRYCAEGIEINGQPVQPNPKGLRDVTMFFGILYGAAIVATIGTTTTRERWTLDSVGASLVVVLVYLALQLREHVTQVRRDSDVYACLSSYTFVPLIRLVPLIGIAVALERTPELLAILPIVLFGIAKALADALALIHEEIAVRDGRERFALETGKLELANSRPSARVDRGAS